MKRVRPTPLGALARGLVAGALGSAVQTLFFKLTSNIRPASQRETFSPPERVQLEEQETETVARRFVEGMMQRPISERGKQVGGTIVHYGFGALFGALYGLARESSFAAKKPVAGLVFGAAVWLFGDELMVPAFRLAGPPGAYSPKLHAYALVSHCVYGASVWAAYELLRPRSLAVAGAALWALDKDISVEPYTPKYARPLVRAVLSSAAKVRARHPIAMAVEAVRSV